ncbi:hypothetical protein Q8A73_018398 [Channa argus]|nr:hypothetical protein Q8A73_018398 [Channa argus]
MILIRGSDFRSVECDAWKLETPGVRRLWREFLCARLSLITRRSLSFFHSVSSSLFLSDTHILRIGKHWPIPPVASSPLSTVGYLKRDISQSVGASVCVNRGKRVNEVPAKPQQPRCHRSAVPWLMPVSVPANIRQRGLYTEPGLCYGQPQRFYQRFNSLATSTFGYYHWIPARGEKLVLGSASPVGVWVRWGCIELTQESLVFVLYKRFEITVIHEVKKPFFVVW